MNLVYTHYLSRFRQTAQGDMGQTATIWRPAAINAGQSGAPSQVGGSVAVQLLTPSNPAQAQFLIDLGSGRASRLAYLPYDTDCRAGDALHIGGAVCAVFGVSPQPDVVIAAVGEVAP